MAKKQLERTGDPFARYIPANNDIGESSDLTDNKELEDKAIESMVPTPGDSSTEEGFDAFLKLLGKDLPPEAKAKLATHPLTKEEPAEQEEEEEEPPKPAPKKSKKSTKQAEKFNPFVPPVKDNNPATEGKQAEKEDDIPDVTDEDVLPLLDSILTKGYASETFYVRGNKIVLRSQFFWEDKKIVELSDSLSSSANFRSTEQFNFNLCALASNLVECGGTYFQPIARGTEQELAKSFNERLDFLMGMPSLLVTYMFKCRAKFVYKMFYLNEHMEDLLKAF